MQLHIIALSASKKYLRSTYWQRVFDIHWIFNFHSSQKIISFLKSWPPYLVLGDCGPGDLGPGGIFANNGLARAHSHAHAYYPWFSVRVDKAMRTENLRMVTAMRTTIALIFCAHDISHAHRKSRAFEQSHGHKHGFSKSSHTHSLGADMMTWSRPLMTKPCI